MCLDIDPNKIRVLESGEIPIFEPGLKELVKTNVNAGRLRFTTDKTKAAQHGLVQFIAVGTPPDEDGSADLKHVLKAAQSIGTFMTADTVVVNKSTVPVGTAQKVKAAIAQALRARNAQLNFSVVSNPEFLKEGAAIEDFMRPDRIVIGTDDDHATDVMKRLYAPFERNHTKLMVMDIRSAELTKYAANAMLATRISFMNELALLAEAVGADIDKVRRGIGSDPRIGTHFLYAGCGYGGSCFPKDVQALVRTGEEHNVPLQVLKAVELANERQKQVLAEKITARFGADLTGKRIALWGLAFKPNTDDMREAPSLSLIENLLEAGATVSAYDPVASHEALRVLGPRQGINYASSAMQALEGASALVVVTEWKEFRSADLVQIRAHLIEPVVFDGRNIFEPGQAGEAGLEYFGIGRT
jgi:UDPglucose 6-dehydrogenase